MSAPVQHQPEIDPTEFREFGYLQEVNRLFFHPLGLALGIGRSSRWHAAMHAWRTRTEVVLYDSRDDPEGVRFEGTDLFPKADRVAQEWHRRGEGRRVALGYQIQPAEPEPE